MTMKDLMRLEIASAATLQRRLRRLKARGAIVQTRSPTDARVTEIALSPRVRKTFARYFELLGIAGRIAGGVPDACGESAMR